jgi:hypothetical protein
MMRRNAIYLPVPFPQGFERNPPMTLCLNLLARQPLFQLIQRLGPMTNLVLLALFHLSVRLALVLKA